MSEGTKVTIYAAPKIVQEMIEDLYDTVAAGGNELEPVNGGDAPENATIIAPGPIEQIKWAKASPGWFDLGNGPEEAVEGRLWMIWWDKTIWSLKDLGNLPQVDTSAFLKNSALGNKKEPIDFTTFRKKEIAINSSGVEISGAGYIIVSKIPVHPNQKYILSDNTIVANAKFLVQLKADNTVLSVVPIVSLETGITTLPQCSKISFTVKAASEATETLPQLTWLNSAEISSINDAEIVAPKAEKILEKLPVSRVYTEGYQIIDFALTSSGLITPGIGYTVMNKIPVEGGKTYVIGGIRPSGDKSKNVSQFSSSGAHIQTQEIQEVPMLVTTQPDTKFLSFTIKSPIETDDFGATNNYFGELALFLSDVKKSKWDGLVIETNGDSRTWYDRRTFGETHNEFGDIVVGYQSYMRKHLGCRIINKGESGWNMVRISNERIKMTDYSEIDAVTITSGANDQRLGTPLGVLAPIGSAFATNTFYGALQSAIEHIILSNRKTKIFLFTPTNGWFKPSHIAEFPNLYKGVYYIHEDFVNAIIEVGRLYGLPVLDLYHLTQINALNKETFIGDDSEQGYWLHENNEGYRIEGELIVDFLNRH